MSLFFVISIATCQAPDITCLDFFSNLAIVFFLIHAHYKSSDSPLADKSHKMELYWECTHAQKDSQSLKSPANAAQTWQSGCWLSDYLYVVRNPIMCCPKYVFRVKGAILITGHTGIYRSPTSPCDCSQLSPSQVLHTNALTFPFLKV